VGDIEVRHSSCGVLVSGESILLGRRSSSARSHHGQWDLIGGHREPGETYEQTMIRELQEELGVTPRFYRCIGVFSEDFAEAQYQIHVFSVHKWEGTPRNCSSEHTEIAWFSPTEISTLNLASQSLVTLLDKLT